MPLPNNTVLKTLTGSPVGPNNKPLTGLVVATLVTPVVLGPDEVVQSPVRARVNPSGVWSMQLLTTTDDTTYPNGWLYQIDTWYSGQPYITARYFIEHTDGDGEGVIDISTLTPTAQPGSDSFYATNADLKALSDTISFTFVQYSLATTWTIDHNLGYPPSVMVVDSTDEIVVPEIMSTDANTMVLRFTPEASGRAYLS